MRYSRQSAKASVSLNLVVLKNSSVLELGWRSTMKTSPSLDRQKPLSTIAQRILVIASPFVPE